MLTSPEQRIWVSADLALFPDNGDRYEIVDGELFVTRAPHRKHQKTCGRLFAVLDRWSLDTGLGAAELGVGLVLGDQDDVIPDVVWLSRERYAALVDESGHLRGAPELVIEVLSPGTENERRDREVKLKLYSIRGVQEYWLADWRLQQVEVYRREGGRLRLVLTLFATDALTSPLLPGFVCPLSQIFED
jgi:Uma2 family endonuclease